MTNILELLKNETVEWKKLGEVCEVKTGKLNANAKEENGIYPFFTCDEKPSRINSYAFDTDAILLSGNGSRIGHVNLYSGKFNAYQRTYVIEVVEKKLNLSFLFHYFKAYVRNYIDDTKIGSSIPYITLPILKNFEIPIPSLETQEKIVEILDKFTNYVTELQSELQSRTKQYTYYRDRLLSEEYLNNVTKEMEEDRRLKIFKLDEIFDFKNGLNKGKEFFGKGVPFISYVNVYKLDRLQEEDIVEKVDLTEDEIERFSVIKGDVLFTRTSEVKEEVGYSSVVIEDLENTVFNGFTIRARLKNKDLLLPEYSAHLFRCYEIRKEIVKRSAFTTRASLSGQELGKVKVVIPPLSLQNKIVKVLDKFQLLLADTKGLIPEEIEQRQKQYEYYREKLLTFDVECDSTHARTHSSSN